MPSLVEILRRCHSTVRRGKKQLDDFRVGPAIAGQLGDSVSWAVSVLLVPGTDLRTDSPVASAEVRKSHEIKHNTPG